MPISIEWGTKTIIVPRSYLTLVSGTRYELDVNQFRLDLKDLEDSEEGMAFPATHQHNTEIFLAGVTYARTFEIINGYGIDFTAPDSNRYSIQCVGANHNISDVLVLPGTRHYTLIIGNSAGLIVSSGPTLVDANILSIDGSTTVPALMRIASETMLIGTLATVISTTEVEVTFSSFGTEETANLAGRRIIFTSGSRAKEAARITQYVGQGASPARLTVTALSALPSVGDTIVVV